MDSVQKTGGSEENFISKGELYNSTLSSYSTLSSTSVHVWLVHNTGSNIEKLLSRPEWFSMRESLTACKIFEAALEYLDTPLQFAKGLLAELPSVKFATKQQDQ